MIIYKKLTSSKFIRNVVLVASGTAGAQLLTLLFMPLITRLYSVEAFGLLGVFTAILAVLVPLAALAYPIAIVLPKKDDNARRIAKLSLIIALTISVIAFIAILNIGDFLIAQFNLEELESYFLLIPVALFFSALLQIMQQWLIRKKQFGITARVAVIQSLIINSVKSVFGLINPTAAVFVFLATFSYALYAIQLWFASSRLSDKNGRITNQINNKDDLIKIGYQFRDFPLYRAPQQFINALSQSLPIIMLASFVGPASVGFYALSKSVMAAPATLIGKSVGDVFYPRITEAAYNHENLFKLVLKATLLLALVAIVPFLIVYVFGPELFSFIFGSEWIMAGEYARWLSLWLLFALLNKPSVAALPVLNLQRFFLCYEIISIMVRGGTLYLCLVVFNNDLYAIQSLAFTGILLNSFLILITLVNCNNFKG